MELDFLKQLDITKDLADALAYLHAQGISEACSVSEKLAFSGGALTSALRFVNGGLPLAINSSSGK
eukprot:1161351-Pelagomonas_calceolata.AAC.3